MPPSRTISFHHPDRWATIFGDLGAFPWVEVIARSNDGAAYPHRVAICLGEGDDGRVVVTGVLVDPRKNLEVPSRLLRDIRLGELVSFAALSPIPFGRVKRSTLKRIRRTRPGPAGHPDEFYRGVADVYKRALRSSRRTPARTTATELGVSEATVHRYLARCRELDYLDKRVPKTKRGRKA